MIEFEPIVTTVYQTSDGKIFYSEEEVIEYVDDQNKNHELDRLKELISDEMMEFTKTCDDSRQDEWYCSVKEIFDYSITDFSEHLAKKFFSDPTWLNNIPAK